MAMTTAAHNKGDLHFFYQGKISDDLGRMTM